MEPSFDSDNENTFNIIAPPGETYSDIDEVLGSCVIGSANQAENDLVLLKGAVKMDANDRTNADNSRQVGDKDPEVAENNAESRSPSTDRDAGPNNQAQTGRIATNAWIASCRRRQVVETRDRHVVDSQSRTEQWVASSVFNRPNFGNLDNISPIRYQDDEARWAKREKAMKEKESKASSSCATARNDGKEASSSSHLAARNDLSRTLVKEPRANLSMIRAQDKNADETNKSKPERKKWDAMKSNQARVAHDQELGLKRKIDPNTSNESKPQPTRPQHRPTTKPPPAKSKQESRRITTTQPFSFATSRRNRRLSVSGSESSEDRPRGRSLTRENPQTRRRSSSIHEQTVASAAKQKPRRSSSFDKTLVIPNGPRIRRCSPRRRGSPQRSASAQPRHTSRFSATSPTRSNTQDEFYQRSKDWKRKQDEKRATKLQEQEAAAEREEEFHKKLRDRQVDQHRMNAFKQRNEELTRRKEERKQMLLQCQPGPSSRPTTSGGDAGSNDIADSRRIGSAANSATVPESKGYVAAFEKWKSDRREKDIRDRGRVPVRARRTPSAREGITVPMPFKFEVDKRGEEFQQKKKSKHQSTPELRKQSVIRAHDIPDFSRLRISQPTKISTTKPKPFSMHARSRAAVRERYDAEQKEKREKEERQRREEEERRKRLEQIRARRKAQPDLDKARKNPPGDGDRK